MSDQFGNTVDGEISVPPDYAGVWDAGYYAGYRQGQADEHERWNRALQQLVENRT